jgi:methylase of polypeptide subunit release factors
MTGPLVLHGATFRWLSVGGAPLPDGLVAADDRLRADRAYLLASRRIGLAWRGDYHNARQLLRALGHRVTGGRRRPPARSAAEAFHQHRRDQARQAGVLGMLLVPLEPGFVVPLRRAPDVAQACAEVYPPLNGPALVALRELLGVIGAHEWRSKGVPVAALDARVHPFHGVYAPTRDEYVDLVAAAPLPTRSRAIDVGTGTGVLAALLAKRGVEHVLATDIDPTAVDCARANLHLLGLADRVRVQRADLFPAGRAGLVVCNPPWLPVHPVTRLDRAVYDPDSSMLRGFLAGLATHLEPDGEGWLVLSDLAERLGLRTRAELLAAIELAGLRIVDRTQTRPRHRRAADTADPLHAARAAEETSLWRLAGR